MEITRFDVASVAKVYGALMAAMGLIIGLIYAPFALLFGSALGSVAGSGSAGLLGGLVMAAIVIIALPVFYGIMGVIFGTIGALLYNFVAGRIGGIKFETK